MWLDEENTSRTAELRSVCRSHNGSIFIQIFVVGSVKRISSATVRIDRSRLSTVIDFGTNRKRVCDFLIPISPL